MLRKISVKNIINASRLRGVWEYIVRLTFPLNIVAILAVLVVAQMELNVFHIKKVEK